MTDAHLMDGQCIHGQIWYECETCDEETSEQMAAWAAFSKEAEVGDVHVLIEPTFSPDYHITVTTFGSDGSQHHVGYEHNHLVALVRAGLQYLSQIKKA